MRASRPGSREQAGGGLGPPYLWASWGDATSGHSLWALKLEQQYLPSLAPRAAEKR